MSSLPQVSMHCPTLPLMAMIAVSCPPPPPHSPSLPHRHHYCLCCHCHCRSCTRPPLPAKFDCCVTPCLAATASLSYATAIKPSCSASCCFLLLAGMGGLLIIWTNNFFRGHRQVNARQGHQNFFDDTFLSDRGSIFYGHKWPAPGFSNVGHEQYQLATTSLKPGERDGNIA